MILKNKKIKIVCLLALTLPNIVFAKTTLSDLIYIFINLGLKIIPFLGVVAFLVFILGVGKFIKASSDEKNKDAKNFLIWGIIGMFILVTIWGILTFIRGEFGLTGTLGIPQIPESIVTSSS